MKCLERKSPSLEITCPHCGSKLLAERGDVYFSKDISGVSVPYVDCSVCHESIDVEGYRDIYKIYGSKIEKSKIYAITEASYELDDYPLNTSSYPIKFYTTKEKRDNAFKALVENRMEWFEKCKNDKYSNQQDYEIGEDTNEDCLELYMGKWAYEYGKTEYDIEE